MLNTLIKRQLQRIKHAWPPETLRGTLYYKWNMRSVNGYVDRFADANPEAFRYFRVAVDSYVAGGGFKYNRHFQIFKLVSLYQLLCDANPETVLELGSGSTTAAVNYWLLNNNSVAGGHARVLDESPEWIQNTLRVLETVGGKSPRLDILHSQRVCVRQSAPRAFRYDISSVEPAEFVIVDGPSLKVDGVRYSDSYSCDVDEIIEAHGAPRVIAIDNRIATCRHLQDVYPTRYDFGPSTNWEMRTNRLSLQSLQFYSVFVHQR